MDRSGKKTQQKAVREELNREDAQRRKERARIYGEIAQPRSHLLKERLISGKTISVICCLFQSAGKVFSMMYSPHLKSSSDTSLALKAPLFLFLMNFRYCDSVC
jgi:hypothetical protein